jgi:hypothetical protein
MNKANSTLEEPQYQAEKKNNYTYVSRQSGDNISKKELIEKAEVLLYEFKHTYDLEKTTVLDELDTYDSRLNNSRLNNLKNVVDLYEWYAKENKDLENQLKEGTNDILTNERKTYYEEQQNDVLNFYYYYFLFTIYVIIVICFGALSLIYPSDFNWKIRVVIFLVLAVLPFISTWLLGKTVQIIYLLFNMLPKNVYK